ncbi:hypothetical protein OHB01_17680 [Microbispora hainanensis]|jgi:hypothetical protein|uniref:Uncharacterized protein n=1 Tax=Microbispora hainanensis TaxID=568844 RepID=A0ABZ1SHY5_9ACTN|nr:MULTISPECIES: hypothetical protein [Microbispora]NJP25663.1 hypothetical protein [Microbispora sp. CL1-1]TQS13165.1 hypothetical protein FLW53_15960 [Microbispora sp. SCL1-1]
MSLHDDLSRLAHEHEDLAEAIDEVLQPVGVLMDRMSWKGPHRDRVQAELGAMRRGTGTVSGSLRERAVLLRGAAAAVPPTPTPGISQPPSPADLVRGVLRQMSPVGPVVSDVLSRYGLL